MAFSNAERESGLETLRAVITPGQTVYTILRSVARSGMSRRLDVLVLYTDDDGQKYPRIITRLVAAACGQSFNARHHQITMGDCGFDAGFQVVYELGMTLFRDGFECVGNDPERRGSRCPSNDHSNGDRDYEPHHHNSGGYALRHEWI